MTAHAYVLNGTVVEVVDINPVTHSAWVSANNPKALAYRPIVNTAVPVYNPATHAVDERLDIELTRVIRSWVVRPLTESEKRKTWTPLQFLERFTAAELDAIEAAVPNDTIVRSFYRAASFATEIVSDDPRTVAGMNYLVSEGILTMERKNQILDGA